MTCGKRCPHHADGTLVLGPQDAEPGDVLPTHGPDGDHDIASVRSTHNVKLTKKGKVRLSLTWTEVRSLRHLLDPLSAATAGQQQAQVATYDLLHDLEVAADQAAMSVTGSVCS